MNMINNSKQRFLTGALCFFMASVTAVPLYRAGNASGSRGARDDRAD